METSKPSTQVKSTSIGERGWKRHFLSSGVPLEHEIARLLSGQDIYWDADFTFNRPSGVNSIDGSVDISAFKYESFGRKEVAYKISMLIECKYRSQNKQTVLLPLISEHSGGAGYTLTHVDDLSHFHLRTNHCSDYESRFPFVYKAVEIFDGGAIEKEFRHGIEQLRYAAPALLRQEIDFQLGSHMDDVIPVFFAKILVTNSPLKILKHSAGLSDVEAASSIDDLTDQIDSCIFYSAYGSDYQDYIRRVFDVDSAQRYTSSAIHADQLSFQGKELSRYSDPARLVQELVKGEGRRAVDLGTQFFVTNLGGLPGLVSGIRQACRATYRTRTRTDTFMKGLRKKAAHFERNDH